MRARLRIVGAAAAAARADGPALLLRIDGDDVFFDLGRALGASPGERVRVLRTVRAIHPT